MSAKKTTEVVKVERDPFGSPYVLALAVIRGPNPEAICRLTKVETIIGRDPETCDFAVEDTLVSAQHCSVRINGGLFSLVDMGSTNGTLVNQQPVGGGVHSRLKHGDEIQIGKTKLLFIAVRFRTDVA
jgi:pSer/pThr/pTyr-binding forkhead associated (FHA) protein